MIRTHRPWRKSFEIFTLIGPWIVTGDEMENPNQLQMNLWVNVEIRQSANTSDLIYDCYKFFEEASNVMTLLPGDIITAGILEGVSLLLQKMILYAFTSKESANFPHRLTTSREFEH